APAAVVDTGSDAAVGVPASMSAVKGAPCLDGRGPKNRNPVETLSMLSSNSMTNARVVLVTDTEYRKAEAAFQSASGLSCRRAPESEPDLAAAIHDVRASHVIVGSRASHGAL